MNVSVWKGLKSNPFQTDQYMIIWDLRVHKQGLIKGKLWPPWEQSYIYRSKRPDLNLYIVQKGYKGIDRNVSK